MTSSGIPSSPPFRFLILLCCLLISTMSPWAQDQGDGATAPAPEESPPPEPYEYLGRFVSRGELTVPPTAVGSRALLASADRRLYLLEAGGEIVWRAELGGKAVAPVTPAASGTLAVLTDAQELSLFDGEDRRLLWRRRIPSGRALSAEAGLPALLASREGTILVAAGSRLSSFSLSGSLLWERELRAPLSTPPLRGSNGILLVGTEEGRLTAYTADGALRWTTLLEEAATDLAESEGGFLVLQGRRAIRRFDGEGTEQRELPLSALPQEFSGSVDRISPAPAGRLVLFNSAAGLVSVSGEGEVLWSASGATDFAPTPEGVLLSFAGGEGELRSYRGRLLWELESEGEIRELLSLRGQMLIVFGDWVVSWYRSGAAVSDGGAESGGSAVSATPGSFHGAAPELAPTPAEEGDLPLLFRELFRSPSRRDREQLLGAIENRAARHDLAGIYRGTRELTVDIALEPYRHPRRQGGAIQNDFPDLRARAGRLLGTWGDLPSWRGLLSLLREETEAQVVLAALEGLSEIPYDREGVAALTMVELVRRWSGEDRFPEIAEGILDVLGALRSAPVPATRGAYTAIATADLPRSTRARARRLMVSHFENRR